MSRRKQIQFHIKSDDYFGTLATVLSLMSEAIERIIAEEKKNIRLLNILKKDLLYLQNNYRIVKKKTKV